MLKKLLMFLFVARVLIPMNLKTYDNVVSWSLFQENSYQLILKDGSHVLVPVMWTIIEEKK